MTFDELMKRNERDNRIVLLESRVRVLESDRAELLAELANAVETAGRLSTELKHWQERCGIVERALSDAKARTIPF